MLLLPFIIVISSLVAPPPEKRVDDVLITIREWKESTTDPDRSRIRYRFTDGTPKSILRDNKTGKWYVDTADILILEVDGNSRESWKVLYWTVNEISLQELRITAKEKSNKKPLKRWTLVPRNRK